MMRPRKRPRPRRGARRYRSPLRMNHEDHRLTRDEFNQWLARHRAAFTAVDKQMASYPRDADGVGVVSRKMIYEAWYRVLADCHLADCLEATARLANGRETPKYFQFDDHPREVRRVAGKAAWDRKRSETAKALIGDERGVHCLACGDSGALLVYHNATVSAALAGETDPTIYTLSVACTCRAGVRLSERGAWATYSERRWCRCDQTRSKADHVEAIMAWVDERKQARVNEKYNGSGVGEWSVT